MAQFSDITWVALLAIAATGILSVLNLIANIIRNEVGTHDLKVRVAQLRTEFAKAKEAIEADEIIEVDVVPDDEQSKAA